MRVAECRLRAADRNGSGTASGVSQSSEMRSLVVAGRRKHCLKDAGDGRTEVLGIQGLQQMVHRGNQLCRDPVSADLVHLSHAEADEPQEIVAQEQIVGVCFLESR